MYDCDNYGDNWTRIQYAMLGGHNNRGTALYANGAVTFNLANSAAVGDEWWHGACLVI